MTGFYLGIFGLAVLLSFVLTRYVRETATAHGWVAFPSSDRHLHTRPLPRLGGVAIYLAFVLSVGLALAVQWWRPRLVADVTLRTLVTALLPGTVVFLLGVYDDLRGTSPVFKFTVQALAGGMLYAFGLRVFDVPVVFGKHHLPWFVSLVLTILWVLAITNAFNLIDGLDGLAAGSALFSTLVVFVVAMVGGFRVVSLLTLLLAGAILGFLRFNFNPATIFLGDCGSLFIGFMLSALAIQGAQKSPTIVAVAIPVVSFGLPILETGLSVVRRLIGGRPVFTADREHIHHKLLQRGLSHRQVVIVLYAVSGMFAMLSLFLLWPTGRTLGLVLAVLGTGIWIGVQHLGYLEFGEIRRVALRTMEQRQIFINNLAIRRATEELKVSRSYKQICRILTAAFNANDFDALDLDPKPASQPGQSFHADERGNAFHWGRAAWRLPDDLASSWRLSLDLVAGNRHCGSMTLYRQYASRGLQLDINLLTSDFPTALAEALDRVCGPVVSLPVPTEHPEFGAQAG